MGEINPFIQHIIPTQNHCKKYYPEMCSLLPPSLPFFSPSFLSLWKQVGIFHLQHISIQTSQISSAQLPNMAMATILDGANVEHRAL